MIFVTLKWMKVTNVVVVVVVATGDGDVHSAGETCPVISAFDSYHR